MIERDPDIHITSVTSTERQDSGRGEVKDRETDRNSEREGQTALDHDRNVQTEKHQTRGCRETRRCCTMAADMQRTKPDDRRQRSGNLQLLLKASPGQGRFFISPVGSGLLTVEGGETLLS